MFNTLFLYSKESSMLTVYQINFLNLEFNEKMQFSLKLFSENIQIFKVHAETIYLNNATKRTVILYNMKNQTIDSQISEHSLSGQYLKVKNIKVSAFLSNSTLRIIKVY